MQDLDDEKQFKLYIRMANSLAIKLTDEKERAIAAKWIRLLENTTDSNATNLKNHAIQLLLLCLLRQSLVGIFEKEPEEEALSQFKWCTLQPHSIAKKILEKEYIKKGEPDIHIELSGDLCEYVAIQEIPKFGHHFYYAYSPENIKKWNNLDKDVIPKGLLNITVITNPDDSTLADTIRSIQKKKQEALVGDEEGKDLLNCNKSSFDKATILEKNGSIHKGFLAEQPAAKAMKEREIQKLMKRGILEPEELDVDNAIIEDGPEIHGPYIENVSIFKNKQELVQSKNVKHSEREDLECDMQSNQIDEARQQMFNKIPQRLRERLSRKYIKQPEKDEENICAPDIFEDDVKSIQRKGTVTGVQGVKVRGQRIVEPEKKKWKIEKFGLAPSEQFRPAHKVIDDLIKEQEEQEERDADEIKESFERSWEKYQEEKQKPFGPEPLSSRRAALLKRLQCLKSRQHKKIVFDDVDVFIEPEEREFEKFVYREYPDDPADVTILDDMPTDDLFGPDQIADIQAIPQPKALYELDKAAILLEAEMKIDDLFGEDQIQHPKLAFKEVAIEGQRDYGCTAGSYRVGKRIVAIPGELPISQSYVEQSGNEALFDDTLWGDYTPPITDSMIKNIADEKLTKLLGGPQQAPRLYGPWSVDFQTYIERIEKVGDEFEKKDEETLNGSILQESQMDTDGMFGQVSEPSPVFQKEKDKRQTQKLETIKKQMAEQKSVQRQWDSNQDFLEPYAHERFYDPPGLLDTSIQEHQQQTPLIKKVLVQPRADPFASFERQLDESLEYFKSEPFSQQCSKPNVFLDSDFLNRRIQNEQIPAENSILDHDEMIDYFQQSQIEAPQKMVKVSPKNIAPSVSSRTPQPIFSHLYISKKNSTPCEIPGILPEAYMEQEISGFEDFLIAPEEDDLQESAQILEPEEMVTADMFGQHAILSPCKAQYQSPARVALIKSIAQTKRFQNLAKKFRSKKGLPQEISPQYNFPKLQKFIDYDEQMFDKASPAKCSPSIDPPLLDKSYNKSGLPAPLIKSPKPAVTIDPFISFEERMNEVLKPEERSFGHSFINEGELSGMFEEDMIGEPQSFQHLGMSEYPQVNKFLLSGINEERIQDVSCLDILSSESQDETMWPDDVQKKYEKLLQLTQNRTPPETVYISNSELNDRYKNAQATYDRGFQPATEETFVSQENLINFPTDRQHRQYYEEDVSQTAIARAKEQTKKMNRFRQKVKTFKNIRNEPKINIPIESLPENRISDVTILYEAANKSGSYKRSTADKTCKIPSPCTSVPCQNQKSEPNTFCAYSIQPEADYFLDNEDMPKYESPVQAKSYNVSFYANQMQSRQIQEEEMPSFQSPFPVNQNRLDENIHNNSYGSNDKLDPTTSLSSTPLFNVSEGEKDAYKEAEFLDCSSNCNKKKSSLIRSPILVDSQASQFHHIKQKFAAWQDLQKGSINNIPLIEAYPYLMKNLSKSKFYESAELSPNTQPFEYAHSRKVCTRKTPILRPDRKQQVSPRTLAPQENLEVEQMPVYQSPPRARPARLSVVGSISGDIFEEDMPEYNTPPKLQPIRTIFGEFKEKEKLLATDFNNSSFPIHTLTCASPITCKSHNTSKSLKTYISKHDSSGISESPYKVNTPKKIQVPKSPLVQQPIPFSPVTWGSFDKTPDFNISPNQLMDEPIQKISPPQFIELANSPQYVTPPKREMLPLNLSPKTRIRALMKKHPVYSVVQLPRKTGFSPLQFGQRVVDKADSNINDEEFPLANLPTEEYRLEDLSYGPYIPTAKNTQWETAERNKRPSTPTIMPSTQSRQSISALISKCELQEGFDWAGDLVPYEQQIQRTPTKSKLKISRTSPKVSQIKNHKSRLQAEKSSYCSSKACQPPNIADFQPTPNLKIPRPPISQVQNTSASLGSTKRQFCRQQCQKPVKSKSNMRRN